MEKFPPGVLTPEVKCIVRLSVLAAVGSPRLAWGTVTWARACPKNTSVAHTPKWFYHFRWTYFLSERIPVVYFFVLLCLFMFFFKLKNENGSGVWVRKVLLWFAKTISTLKTFQNLIFLWGALGRPVTIGTLRALLESQQEGVASCSHYRPVSLSIPHSFASRLSQGWRVAAEIGRMDQNYVSFRLKHWLPTRL